MFSQKEKELKTIPVQRGRVTNNSGTIKGYFFGAISAMIFFTGLYMFANVTAISRAANLFIYHREVLNNTKVMNNLVTKTFAVENLEVVVEGVKK